MLAALSLDGLDAPWGGDGAVKGALFPCWVREVLGPTWQPGDIGLWDNLSAPKSSGGGALLAARGARLSRFAP
jgi:hypothetical protein